jgi:alpha-glucosidase
MTDAATALTVSQRTECNYQPSYATSRVVLHGLPAAPLSAVADGQLVALGAYTANQTTIAAPTLVVGIKLKKLKIGLELSLTSV